MRQRPLYTTIYILRTTTSLKPIQPPFPLTPKNHLPQSNPQTSQLLENPHFTSKAEPMDALLSEHEQTMEEKSFREDPLEEARPRRRSKQAFQLDIHEHLDRIQQEIFPSATRISSGHGILCATIHSATFAATETAEALGRCFVKALYVEPGATDNVLFRSKQPIFTTEEVGEEGGCYAWDVSFEYEIHPPLVAHVSDEGRQLSDWNALPGDILFTLYDSSRGKANVFLGQTLVPLRGLVDGIGASIRGGQQPTKRQDFILRRRDGSVMQASLNLALKLHLPPEEPVTPRASSCQKKAPATFRPRSRKGHSGKQDIHVQHLRHSRRRRARTRTLRQEQISRENDQLNRRVRAVEPTLNLPKSRRKRRGLDDAAGFEGEQLRSQVVDSITRMRIRLNMLSEKKSKAKQRIVRAERLIKKLRQDMETLQEERAMLPALVKVKNSSQLRSGSSGKKAKEAEPPDAELLDLRNRVLKAMTAYGDISNSGNKLKKQEKELRLQEDGIRAALQDVQSRTIKAKRRRRSLIEKAMFMRKADEVEAVRLLEEIRGMKVQEKVAQEEQVAIEEAHARRMARMDDEISKLKAKLERKRSKTEAADAQAKEFAAQSEVLKEEIAVLVVKLAEARDTLVVNAD